MRPFVLWLCGVYAGWLTLVALGDYWDEVAAHWPIAVAMALGSYFAGSTPMGGGTVGFPVLVLLFDQEAQIGRDFSFAIQSVGMTSAAILIVCLRQPLELRLLRWSMLGAAVGTPLGCAFLAPVAPGLLVKLVFAILWASFGMMHLAKIREIASASGITPTTPSFDRAVGLLVGFAGGATVAAMTGVGVDMLLYVALVLLARADLKVAIPTSVVLMAWTSIVGIATNTLLSALDPLRYPMPAEVLHNWLAAAPIVALGAPVGVFIVRRIPRAPTLVVVSLLCLVQLAWTIVHEWDAMTPPILVATGTALVLMNALFMGLHRIGARLTKARGHVDLG